MRYRNGILGFMVLPLTLIMPYSNINSNNVIIGKQYLIDSRTNDVVPENQLVASTPTNFETIAIPELEQPIIPNTNEPQKTQLEYILGKYPSGSIAKVNNTIPFSELSRIGVKYFNKITDINRMVSDLNGFQNDVNSSGLMEFNDEVLIPLNKLVDKNRLDILYRDGSTFNFNIVNRFKNGNNNSKIDIFNNDYSVTILPSDLQSNEYIEKSSFDINFSFKANANLDADVNFKPMKIRFWVNKEYLKINLLDEKSNLMNKSYFDLISNSGVSLKKLFPIGSEFSLMINSISYDLIKNYSSKVDDIGSPRYVENERTGEVYIDKPIPIAINSPFMISFKPIINDGNSFESLLFVDHGDGSFQQVGIDPKTGLQVFNFFKTYNEIIKSNKLTGINKIRIQIRKNSDGIYNELIYYRIFEMSINSAQMYFDLYGYDSKKYSDILKLYTSKTVEELNKNSSTYKSDKKQTPNKYYREFLDEQTGMYKPKIAWVKYRNKNGFLLDPYDENNQKLNEETDQSKYDVGFIAELNAPALYSSDLKTSDQIGAVNQIIDVHYTNTVFNVKTEYSVDPDFKYPDGKKPSIKLLKQKVSSIPLEDNNEYKQKIFNLVYELLSDEDKKTFDVINPINSLDKFMVSKIDYNYLANSINVSWEFPNYYINGKASDNPKQGNFTLNWFDSTSKYNIRNIYSDNKMFYSSSSDKSLISDAEYSLIDFSKENTRISVNEYKDNQVINNTPIGSPDESKNIYRYDVHIKKPNYDDYGSGSVINLDKIEDQIIYQFLKIDNTKNQKLWQEFIDPNSKNTKTIFDWFNYKNSVKNSSEKINDEIFVDFWSTTQGFHLIEFLKQNGIVQEGGEVKFMQTADLKSVLNYWKMYVNTATIQNINFPKKMVLNNLELSKINTSYNNKNDIEKYKNDILTLINNELVKQLNFHYIFKENEELKPEDLTYGIDYEIPNLDQIINNLIQNYNDKNAFKGFELRIKSIPGSSKIFGETKITIANYEGARLLLDLAKIKSPTIVNFNSWNRGFNDVVFPSLGNDKNGKVKKIISDSIQTILDRNSKKFKKYKIKYNIDYTIKFKRLNPINLNVEYSTNINEAVMWLLDESIEKNNTIDAIVLPINNEEILPKATGQTLFRFNNSEANEVISNDPESSQILPEWIDSESMPTNPNENENNQNPNVQNQENSVSKYIKENLGWMVPTIIGSILLISFIIWGIRVRIKSKKMKI